MIRILSISPAGVFTVQVDGVAGTVTVPISKVTFGRTMAGEVSYDMLQVEAAGGSSSFPLATAEPSIRAVGVLAFAYYNNVSIVAAANLAKAKFGDAWLQAVLDDTALYNVVAGVTLPAYVAPVVPVVVHPDLQLYRALGAMTTVGQVTNALKLYLKATGNVPSNEP